MLSAPKYSTDRISAPQLVHFRDFAIILSMVGTARENDRTAKPRAAPQPPEQRERLARYLDELQRWNRRINLTSVPAASAWARLVEESLTLAALAGIQSGERVIDVGSGAGIPGIVVAITHPDVAVTLLESDTRKAGFLTHVAGMLELHAVSVLDRRAEEAGHDASLRETFHAALSRAAAPTATLCELTLPFVHTGGRVCAQVSDAAAEAQRCQAAAVACGGDTPRAVSAHVLCVRKIAATPSEYPRRTGVPSRRPLR